MSSEEKGSIYNLQWAKDRALAYLPSDPTGAMTSFLSDLNKLDDGRDYKVIQELGFMNLLCGFLSTPEQVRNFIEGTN